MVSGGSCPHTWAYTHVPETNTWQADDMGPAC
jgi:hypothetical protein